MKTIFDITTGVKWIGVQDPDLRTFDVVMETLYGTTYNSYFIEADKKTIIETTKEQFWDEYLYKIQQVCNPADIEYIVLNHTEPDHSGNLKNLLKIAPRATVVGSGNAIRYLNDLMNISFPHIIVKDGQTLDLGNRQLRFISAPNLHWPDSMYTYLEDEKFFSPAIRLVRILAMRLCSKIKLSGDRSTNTHLSIILMLFLSPTANSCSKQ